jgi:hypothetical protein
MYEIIVKGISAGTHAFKVQSYEIQTESNVDFIVFENRKYPGTNKKIPMDRVIEINESPNMNSDKEVQQ